MKLNVLNNDISSKYRRESWFALLGLSNFIAPDDLSTAKFRNWLKAPDPSTNHNNARQKHHEATGQWLLQDERYVAWKKQPNSLLWINGTCESHTSRVHSWS